MSGFSTVSYLGIKETKKNEIEFFIQREDKLISCVAKVTDPIRKNFLESLKVGVPIQIQANFENAATKTIPVNAFII